MICDLGPLSRSYRAGCFITTTRPSPVMSRTLRLVTDNLYQRLQIKSVNFVYFLREKKDIAHCKYGSYVTIVVVKKFPHLLSRKSIILKGKSSLASMLEV